MSTDLVNLAKPAVIPTSKPLRNAKGQLLPNQVLNPTGRPKSKHITDAIKYYLEQDKGRYSGLSAHAIAKKALTIAAKGKDPVAIHAIQFVTEQVEGKPTQRVEIEQSLDPDTAQRLADIAERLCVLSK